MDSLFPMEMTEKRLRSIGHAVARARMNHHLSQTALAVMIGKTDHAYISRIECGKQAPSLDVLFDLADALEVEVKYFFTEI